MSGAKRFVSVVVPTYDRADVIADCIASLRDQDYPPELYEIVVVDDGSAQDIRAAIAAYIDDSPPVVRLVRQANAGQNAARNRGIDETKGDPIVFVDDDVIVPRGWLSAFVDAVQRYPDAGCLGGPARARFEGSLPRMCPGESIIGGDYDFGPDETIRLSVYGMNLCVRRWAIELAGRFDESLPQYGEEEEWQSRLRAAGSYSVYVPAAWLEHRRTAAELTKRSLLRQAVRRGRSYPHTCVYLGRHISLVGELRRAVLELIHAIRFGCFGGVQRAVYALSSARVVVRRATVGPRSPLINLWPARAEWERLRRSRNLAQQALPSAGDRRRR